MGRPDLVWLRLELYNFGIGDTIAELHAFSLVNGARTCIETLDGKFLAAELFQSDAVVFQLFARGFFAGSALDRVVLLPAGIQDPRHNNKRDTDEERRIQQWILKRAFRPRLCRSVSQHGCLFRERVRSRFREGPTRDSLREVFCMLVLAEDSLRRNAKHEATRRFEERSKVTTILLIVDFD
jgi:hypothetical protein